MSVILDAGPMVAMHNRSEEEHALCLAVLSSLREPAVTTWPVLTEALHVLGSRGGFRAQRGLLRMVAEEEIGIDVPRPASALRMVELMTQYSDVPMDLGDASIVELCERTVGSRVFTLDADFHVYRMRGNKPIPLVG